MEDDKSNAYTTRPSIILLSLNITTNFKIQNGGKSKNFSKSDLQFFVNELHEFES